MQGSCRLDLFAIWTSDPDFRHSIRPDLQQPVPGRWQCSYLGEVKDVAALSTPASQLQDNGLLSGGRCLFPDRASIALTRMQEQPLAVLSERVWNVEKPFSNARCQDGWARRNARCHQYHYKVKAKTHRMASTLPAMEIECELCILTRLCGTVMSELWTGAGAQTNSTIGEPADGDGSLGESRIEFERTPPEDSVPLRLVVPIDR
ncbi:hypothetical protein VTI74DRAFT_836 [Chaetomium olivicolor]